jgi:hypothetical protein
MDHYLSSSPHYFIAGLDKSSSNSESINLEKPSQSEPILQIPSLRNYHKHSTTLVIESNSVSLDVPTPLARARLCDVYIGHNRLGPPLSHRLVKWLTSELELLGISVFTTDRSRNKDAISHCAAKVAMDVVQLGILVITVPSLSNAFSIEEMLIFSQNRKLVPVFVGLTRDDCVSLDVIQRKGDLWDRFGGELWRGYEGRGEDWIEAVDGLSRVDMDFEASAANLRDCILNVVAFIGKRLGKRSINESIQKWSESFLLELPFPRNKDFFGRKRELRQLEYILFHYIEGDNEENLVGSEIEKEKENRKGKKPLTNEEQEYEQTSLAITENGSSDGGIVCVTGETGIGKTELLLEFAYLHLQRYKSVFWVSGESRFLRENYMKLSGPLGIDAGIDTGSGASSNIEDEAIGKVRKEFTRDIPYLILIDNMEMEGDFWDGKPISDLLPAFSSQTHVLISTRLPRISNTMQFKLSFPSSSQAMALIKGETSLLIRSEDDVAVKIIQEKLRRLPFGLVLVRMILSQLSIDAQTLLELLENPMLAEISYRPIEDPVFQYNPLLVQLLDVSFFLFNQLYKGTQNLALNMIEISTWFGPSLIPVCMLAYVASGGTLSSNPKNIWKRLRNSMFSLPCMGTLNEEGKEAKVLSILMQFGIARTGTQPGHVCFHDIFKLYARNRSNVEPNSSFVEAVIDEGFLPEYSNHVWAASFLVLKFGLYHPVLIDLVPCDILLFIKRLVIPLVTYSLNELSLCSVVLEILRVATQRLELLENSLLDEVETMRKNRSFFGRKNRSVIESEPSIHHDIFTLRGAILETRAKIMIKMGKYDVAEDLCRIAINIKEVIYGVEHVETQSAKKIMDLIASFKLRF